MLNQIIASLCFSAILENLRRQAWMTDSTNNQSIMFLSSKLSNLHRISIHPSPQAYFQVSMFLLGFYFFKCLKSKVVLGFFLIRSKGDTWEHFSPFVKPASCNSFRTQSLPSPSVRVKDDKFKCTW